MSAAHIEEITLDAIDARLNQAIGASLEWTGRMPRNTEELDNQADTMLSKIDHGDVMKMLERHELIGETAQDEIDMAISQACEFEGFPENAIVVVQYEK